MGRGRIEQQAAQACVVDPNSATTCQGHVRQFVKLQLYTKKFVQDWPLGMTRR